MNMKPLKMKSYITKYNEMTVYTDKKVTETGEKCPLAGDRWSILADNAIKIFLLCKIIFCKSMAIV